MTLEEKITWMNECLKFIETTLLHQKVLFLSIGIKNVNDVTAVIDRKFEELIASIAERDTEIERLKSEKADALLIADDHAMGRVENAKKAKEWEESFHQSKAHETARSEKIIRLNKVLAESQARESELAIALEVIINRLGAYHLEPRKGPVDTLMFIESEARNALSVTKPRAILTVVDAAQFVVDEANGRTMAMACTKAVHKLYEALAALKKERGE